MRLVWNFARRPATAWTASRAALSKRLVSFPRTVRHLVSRFFRVLFSRPLGPRDQDWVNGMLRPEEAVLFWEQAAVDQRHAFEVAHRVKRDLGDDRGAIAAALLHDVGKRHSDAGPIGRSIATVLDGMGLPMTADWRRYRDHGELGAVDLERIEADALTVGFARGRVHPELSVERRTWNVLMAADNE